MKVISRQIYLLRGMGFHFALLGFRVGRKSTMRFDTFGDPVFCFF